MVEANYLTYPSKDPFLKKITFNLSPGEITGLIGKSGSGKSLLLKLLSGTDTDFNGELSIKNFLLKAQSKNEITKLASLNTAMIPQNLDETVYHYLLLARMPFKKFMKPYSELDLQIVEKYIEAFELNEFRNHSLKNIPRGALTMVNIACQFSRESSLLLLDEPSCNLAPDQIKILIRQLTRYVSDGLHNCVIASNNISFLAQVSDSLIILQEGQLADIINTEKITAPLLSHYLGTEIFVSRNIYNGRPEVHIFPEN